MNFVLTTYVYPLAQPVVLSNSLRIQLDNPRTKDEIDLVEAWLMRASDSGEDYAIPVYSEEDIITTESVLLRFRDSVGRKDPDILRRFRSFKREKILKFLASIWVVARYDDQGEAKRLSRFHKRMRAKGEPTFSILDEEHPIVKGQALVSDYAYLLSLLVNSEGDGYYGRGFIIDEPRPTRVQDKSMWFQLLLLSMVCRDYEGDETTMDESLSWVFFPYVREKLEQRARLLEEAFNSGSTDKLLYVGSLLRVSAEAGNERVRLVLLTSILELLLTHSPDHSRFNVDESISKQFRLKAGLLVYLNDKTRNLDRIRERLKIIYNQRSNVAHGNFVAVNKYVSSLPKEEGQEEYFSDLITDLYLYVRAVIEEYLKDKQLVEYLKAN
jgi:hypothetical protein